MSDAAPTEDLEAQAIEVPELGRLAWMVFFEPVTLFHVLSEAGVASPGMGLVAQLTSGSPAAKAYGLRMGLVLAILAPLVTLIVAGVFGVVGVQLPRAMVMGVLASGMASGVVWAVLANLPFGTALALVLPLAGLGGLLLLSSGVVPAEPTWRTALLVGGVPGSAAGLVFGVARALTSGEPLSLARGGVVALLVAAMAALMTAEGGVGYAFSVAGWILVGFSLFCYRLVFWPLEAITQLGLYALERGLGWHTLRFSPVLFHDLSYLPLPGLRAHVELGALDAPELSRRVLASCFIAPGQRRTGRALQEALRRRDAQARSGT